MDVSGSAVDCCVTQPLGPCFSTVHCRCIGAIHRPLFQRPLGCPETSVTKCQFTLHDITEEPRSELPNVVHCSMFRIQYNSTKSWQIPFEIQHMSPLTVRLFQLLITSNLSDTSLMSATLSKTLLKPPIRLEHHQGV
jgi:hypothetical protein